MELKFRNLNADEIELRVGNTKRKNQSQPKSKENPVVGFQLLLYKTARVDANILDETVGTFNWQKKFYQVKDTMICSLGINANYDKASTEPYWVWKDDAGDVSETEAVKGEASDSFKRAAFAFGLGRNNLYYAPFIWVKCENDINEYTKFYVSEIAYDKNGYITKLIIREQITDNLIFSYPKNAKVSQNGGNQQNNAVGGVKQTIAKQDLEIIELYLGQCNEEKRKSFFTWLDGLCGTMTPANLSYEQGKEVAQKLKGRLVNGK